VDFGTHPYTLDDLVDDAFGLLDRLDVRVAHWVGLSQGGNMAYLAGLKCPARVASITALMSSPDLGPKNDAFTGKPDKAGQLPRPAADYVRAVVSLNSTPATSDEEIAERFMENFRLAAGGKSPFNRDFWLAMGRAVAARKHSQHAKMANHSNHSKAQMATAPLAAEDLARLIPPCLVIHGEMDPIFPPAHAEWAASNLQNAELSIIADMGHALDPAFFEPVVDRLRAFLPGSKDVAVS
jgi:pimeloyl-ACP methyl ester carboxylesterase